MSKFPKPSIRDIIANFRTLGGRRMSESPKPSIRDIIANFRAELEEAEKERRKLPYNIETPDPDLAAKLDKIAAKKMQAQDRLLRDIGDRVRRARRGDP